MARHDELPADSERVQAYLHGAALVRFRELTEKYGNKSEAIRAALLGEALPADHPAIARIESLEDEVAILRSKATDAETRLERIEAAIARKWLDSLERDSEG